MKGRIQVALESAKQRRTADPADAKVRGPSAGERQAANLAIRAFPFVPYDPAECSRNRVLVPESDRVLRTTGASAYRMLRTRLLQRCRSNNWRTIGITSPGQGAGKSVTSLNLALSIAREGNNNVFLIDLDMRNPKMCQYLGATPPVDINHYLSGDVRAEDSLFSVGIDNLALGGTLTNTDEASELLASGRLEELFAYIYSIAPEPLILLDLPPLLSTDDALVVAPKVDACLLIVAEGHSRRDGAARALELLTDYKLAGIVLNQSRAVVKDYYSSYA